MEKTNRLSGRPDLKVRLENDNENQNFIKKERIRGMMEVVVEEPETILVGKIKKAREKDEKVVRIVL